MKRDLKFDMLGLVLAGLAVFTAVSLAGHSPLDPVNHNVFPAVTQVQNPCGWAGAHLAHRLTMQWGLIAWSIPLLGLTAAWAVWRRYDARVVLSWMLGQVFLAGCLATIITESTLFSWPWLTEFHNSFTHAVSQTLIWIKTSPWTSPAGPGGQIGLLISDQLRQLVSTVGVFLVMIPLAIISTVWAWEGAVRALALALGWLATRLALVPVMIARGLWKVIGPLAKPLVAGPLAVGKFLARLATFSKSSACDDSTENSNDWTTSDDEVPLVINAGGPEPPIQVEPTDEIDQDSTEEDEPLAVHTHQDYVEDDDASSQDQGEDLDSKSSDQDDEFSIPIKHVEEEQPPAPAINTPTFSSPPPAAEDRPSEPDYSDYRLPDLALLDEPEFHDYSEHEADIRAKAKLLEQTFAQFKMRVKVVQIDTGPVVTQYEIELEPGLRARRVLSMSDDLAIALRAPTVRIVAPIPGKNTVGIEVPNEHRAKVGLSEVMSRSQAASAKMGLPIYLGKDVKGQPLSCDLCKMPHLLIAGRTGTGKSVCLNSLILSLLMTRRPDHTKLLMIDPKMVELSLYENVPHLMHPVVTDMNKAAALLGWAVDKMEERYSWLSRAGVRHIDSYNKMSYDDLLKRIKPGPEESARMPKHMPYIVIVADEMADLMMTAAKEVEGYIIRLAQKSRAVGIHLVLATQKPTVDVVTGLIKSNLPARIAFQVASRSDSRVVLDEMGADKLLGNGDMLFLSPGTSKLVRAQGTFVSDEEVTRITEFLSEQAEPQFDRELIELPTNGEDSNASGGIAGVSSAKDDLYPQAVEVVLREQRGSVSLLQRALGIGYGRAARLIDFMAEDGIVGQYNGAQAREVMFTPESWNSRMQAAG